MTFEVIKEEHGEGCPCCLDEVEMRLRAFLEIRVPTPHDDDSLEVTLYHNWIIPETMYLVFGKLYRILGLLPQNPLLQWLGVVDEAEKSQD